MDLHRSSGGVSGFCFPLASVCEHQRERAIRLKVGKPTACTTQRTAYCIETTIANSVSRQLVCARTMDNCVRRRKDRLENPPPIVNHATPCQPTLNTDTYETGREQSGH